MCEIVRVAMIIALLSFLVAMIGFVIYGHLKGWTEDDWMKG
jgi:hypothetical protein